MLIKETVLIKAPLETVWDVFTDIDNWSSWNTVCKECRFEDGAVMEEGACISFELNPMIFSLRIAPVIETYVEGKSITWTGSKWGIHARHTFTFEHADDDDDTNLESIEEFSGLIFWGAKLIGLPGRLHELTRRMMLAIKVEAEFRAAINMRRL